MKWISLVLFSAIMVTCGGGRKVRHHSKSEVGTRKSEVKNRNVVSVDSNWVTHYRELEKEFNYTVSDDEKIKAVGSRFHVPTSVRDHYQDMLRAKGAGP